MVTLFSTNCPRCKVVEAKLKQAGIEYDVETDVNKMLSMGIKEAPKLSVNGTFYGFKEALNWIKEQQKNGN